MNEERCVPTQVGMAIDSKSLTRQRYIELIAIANRACDELKKAGLKNNEYCVFGRIMESMLPLE
jgi:hypothetical protein